MPLPCRKYLRCRRVTHSYQTTKLKNKTECLQTHDWIRRFDPVPTTSLEFNNIEKVYLVRDWDQLKKKINKPLLFLPDSPNRQGAKDGMCWTEYNFDYEWEKVGEMEE